MLNRKICTNKAQFGKQISIYKMSPSSNLLQSKLSWRPNVSPQSGCFWPCHWCNGYLTDAPDNVLLATLAMLTHQSFPCAINRNTLCQSGLRGGITDPKLPSKLHNSQMCPNLPSSWIVISLLYINFPFPPILNAGRWCLLWPSQILLNNTRISKQQLNVFHAIR